jgi:ribonucleotide monophosphatase NagD (HAD superfamily)
MGRFSAALIDIDGVLMISWQPLLAAVDAVNRLREMGSRLRC